jgi:hypothetical protein
MSLPLHAGLGFDGGVVLAVSLDLVDHRFGYDDLMIPRPQHLQQPGPDEEHQG